MENLEQVKEALGDHAQSEAIMTAVSSFIQKEKDIGVESKRKSNSESQGLRTRLKSIQESLVNEGIDFEGDVGEQIKKLMTSKKQGEPTKPKQEPKMDHGTVERLGKFYGMPSRRGFYCNLLFQLFPPRPL